MRIIFALVLSGFCSSGITLQEERWDSATIPARNQRMVSKVVDRIMSNAERYKAVDQHTNVPWYVISALHSMESSGSFRHHLHEGSPLRGRTRWVPKGRPKSGSPPFTWEESAKDALLYDKMGSVKWSRLHDTLYAAERYNGTGYLLYHKSTPTPYLWSKTSIEKPGKYISDGKWSSTARSKQVGCAAIWKEMENRGILNFNRLKR